MTKKFVKFVFLLHTLFFFGYSANGLAQSSLKKPPWVLRSNFQSNTAATTLHSSSNAKVMAQYVIGQTPLLGKVSVAGVEVRQGFIQPIGFISSFSQPSPALTTSVYPNPFAGNLIIEFNTTPIYEVHTSFFDMRGRLVTRLIFDEPGSRIDIGLSHLAAGKYLLVINTGAQTFTKHLLKIN